MFFVTMIQFILDQVHNSKLKIKLRVRETMGSIPRKEPEH